MRDIVNSQPRYRLTIYNSKLPFRAKSTVHTTTNTTTTGYYYIYIALIRLISNEYECCDGTEPS